MNITWKTEVWPIDKVRPLENNPFGKITVVAKQRLRNKLKELGNFDVATVDRDGTLLTFNKRYALLKELGHTELEVKVPDRNLTEEERKKIILSSNIHEGEWITEILQADFSDIDFSAIGLFLQQEEERVLAAAKDIDGNSLEPELKIAPRFDESHKAFIIVCNSAIDINFIRTALGFESAKSYKNQETGACYVITAAQFSERWNANQKS